MALNNAIVRNKTIVQEILSADPQFILDKVIEKGLITGREYTKLNSITKGDAEDLVIKLVDTLINKGRQSEFIGLLQDEIVLDYPKLKDVEWGDSGSTASSSSLSIGHGDNKTVVEPWEKTRELGRIGSELIDWLSDDDVLDLLYYLRKMNVLNDEEKKTVEGKMTREDKARCLIDTLMKKGEKESRLMVDYLTEKHPDLCSTLGLTTDPAQIKLGRIRSELIYSLSDLDVFDLLYYLMKMDMLNDQEMKTVEGKMTSKDRARCLIDTVMRKGEKESRLMVDYLSERHPDLCWTLGLTPTSAWIKSITETRSAGPDLSDKQLLEVVKTLGQEWEQVAIHLEMDNIKADGQTDVAMQKLKMLAEWRRRRPPGKARAQDLLRALEDLEDLPVETRELLTGELGRIRSEFVKRVSIPVIKALLDDLWQQKVFSIEEKDTVMESFEIRGYRARCLIDMVIQKGKRASKIMIDRMKKRDPYLSSTLGLISYPAGGLKAEVKLKRLFSRARDKKTRFAGQDLSDKQLLKVAETLGQEWEQAAIHLGLKTRDLDDIKAEHRSVAMQKQKMLVLWKRRRPPGAATAQDLRRGLEDLEDLPVETRLLLEGRALSNEQLLKVAETLGKEWERAAIHLDLKTEDLDGIKAENMTVIMQKYKMLQLWQSQRPFGKDTAQDLLRGLEDMEDVPVETRLLLTGFGRSQESFGSGQESPSLMSPSLPLEMHEGDSELGYLTKDPELDLMSEESGIESMADSDSCSESSSSESMSESELSVDGNMLGLGDDKTVVKPKKQRRDSSAVFDEEDEDLRSKVERWNTDPSAVFDEEDEDLRSKVERWNTVPNVIDEEDEGTSLTEDIASMSLMDRCEKEDGSDSDASAEIDEEDEEEMHVKSRCEKCKAAQQCPEYEKVTPTKLSKWSFQVQLEGEGTHECSATGLVFEVSEQALVRYSVLSWSEFSDFLEDSWKPAGSIYDVDVEDPSVLKFIHFPHSLCLDEPEHELSFSVLHVKGSDANIEPTVYFTASHVKWRVSSLSPVGPIIPSPQHVKHDGAVVVYKEGDHQEQFCFHVFLALNSRSEFQAIREQVSSSGKNLKKIYQSVDCTLEETFYHLTSKPEGGISPPHLEFRTRPVASKGFFKATFDQPPTFELFLKDSDSVQKWTTKITEGDWADKVPKSRKRIKEQKTVQKRKCFREVMPNNNPLLADTNRGQALTSKQLLQVAETLGQEWGRVGIYLGLSTTDLDNIKAVEADVTMQKMKMLELWQRRTPGKATAQDLLRGLQDLKDLPVETRQLLRDWINGTLPQPDR